MVYNACICCAYVCIGNHYYSKLLCEWKFVKDMVHVSTQSILFWGKFVLNINQDRRKVYVNKDAQRWDFLCGGKLLLRGVYA